MISLGIYFLAQRKKKTNSKMWTNNGQFQYQKIHVKYCNSIITTQVNHKNGHWQ